MFNDDSLILDCYFTYNWCADLIQRQAVVKATFIEHTLGIIIGVGPAIAWRPNKQPVQHTELQRVTVIIITQDFIHRKSVAKKIKIIVFISV